MNEYKVGCIADLISHGKLKTKKKKKLAQNSQEDQVELTPKKKKKLNNETVNTKPSTVLEDENKWNKKNRKKNKYRLNSETMNKGEIGVCNQTVEPNCNYNQINNSTLVSKKKKKKKHKNKTDSMGITNTNVNSNKSPLSDSNVNAIKNNNNKSKKKKKKKQKNKLNVIEMTDYNQANSEVKNESEASPLKTKKKSKKRKMPEGENESTENSEFSNPKKKKEDLLDIDHVPTDSEEENENETNEKPQLKDKKMEFKDFTENTVFVGNIPINYDKHKVHKMFSKFGKIKSARIRCVPISNINMSKKVAAVTKDFNPKRNSLVAYVKYDSKEGATAALEANGMVIDGHHIRVDLAENKSERDNNKAVFVGGLPFDVEDDELWAFFEKCGKIVSVRVVRDSQTSMGKGFGYVNFDSTASVELALQLDGELLKKRAINVKRCVKSRNKNKMNAFGKNKSKEMANQLLAKKGKKLKAEKKKEKFRANPATGDFQGRKANVKEKKKKKPSKSELQKRKIVKILGFSGKEVKK